MLSGYTVTSVCRIILQHVRCLAISYLLCAVSYCHLYAVWLYRTLCVPYHTVSCTISRYTVRTVRRIILKTVSSLALPYLLCAVSYCHLYAVWLNRTYCVPYHTATCTLSGYTVPSVCRIILQPVRCPDIPYLLCAVSYCKPYAVWLYRIATHYPTNGMICEKRRY